MRFCGTLIQTALGAALIKATPLPTPRACVNIPEEAHQIRKKRAPTVLFKASRFLSPSDDF